MMSRRNGNSQNFQSSKMGVGEMGQIVGETGVAEMGVGEMGVIHYIVPFSFDRAEQPLNFHKKNTIYNPLCIHSIDTDLSNE